MRRTAMTPAALASIAIAAPQAMAIEEPEYEVLRTNEHSNVREDEPALVQALEQDGFEPRGALILAHYNAPFTPWFMRRNEAMVEIDWPTSAGNTR